MGGVCKDIKKLVPELQTKCGMFLEACAREGIEVVLLETYRSNLVQAAYYAQGRESLATVNLMRKGAGLAVITEKENVKITNTKPGQSKHNRGEAFDVCPAVHGKLIWNDSKLWKRLGELGKMCGLKWGGDFRSIKDCPHFEI